MGKEHIPAYSGHIRYIQVANLKTISSEVMVRAVKEVFACHGILEEVMSDNSPQFVSHTNSLQKFATSTTPQAVHTIPKQTERLRGLFTYSKDCGLRKKTTDLQSQHLWSRDFPFPAAYGKMSTHHLTSNPREAGAHVAGPAGVQEKG